MNQLKFLLFFTIPFFLSFANTNHPISVRIGKMHDAPQGTVVTLPVYLTNLDYEIKSFDFLISFDTRAFFLESVNPSNTPESVNCFWDRFDIFDCTKKDKDSSCPRGTVRISATVKGNNSEYPNCLNKAIDFKLFEMKLMITNDRTFEGGTYPIYFAWHECLDNIISVESRELGSETKLLCADSVYFEYSYSLRQIMLPSAANFPESCLFSNSQNQNRAVDFEHGYINLCCYHMTDDFGDVNLNGLSNEVADFLLFQDYFLYGLPVFAINPAGQIANTDVNWDGKTVTLSDLVYLDAIVTGDAKPLEKVRPIANGTISVEREDNIVTFESDSVAYTIWLQFKGAVSPTTRLNTHVFRYFNADSVTNVLFYGLDSTLKSKIEIIPYMPGCILIDAQAATRGGTQFDLNIEN